MKASSVSSCLPDLYHVPGTVLNASHALAHQILPQSKRWVALPLPLTDEEVPFVYFCFYFQYSGRWIIEDSAMMYVGECFAYVNF